MIFTLYGIFPISPMEVIDPSPHFSHHKAIPIPSLGMNDFLRLSCSGHLRFALHTQKYRNSLGGTQKSPSKDFTIDLS